MRMSRIFLGLVLSIGLAACDKQEAEVDNLSSLTIFPSGATIDVATSITMRGTGVLASGLSQEIDISWEVDGPGTIDENGVFTPTGEGSVMVTGTAEDLTGEATIVVSPVGTLVARVVNSATSRPYRSGVLLECMGRRFR